MSEPKDEFTELLSGLLDQELSEPQRRRLAEILQESAAARRQYLDMLELSALLACELAAPLDPAPPATRASQSPRTTPTWLLTLAAGLLIGVAIAAWRLWPSPEIVAHVTMVGSDQRFELPASRIPGENLLAGETLSLAGGFVQVEFASGAKIVLQGKGELVVDHSNGCRLLSGDLAADVPQSAAGFTVETPSGVVRDLGTRFCLRQLPQEAWRLSVVQGTVELVLAARQQHAAVPTRLAAGTAVQFGGDREEAQTIDYAISEFESTFALLDKIERYEGPLVLLPTPPESVHAQFFAADKSAILLVEQQDVALADDLLVDLTPSGTDSLASGMTLSSFLVHLDVANDLIHDQPENKVITGVITFRQPISGVVRESQKLLATDATFGLPETTYPSQGSALAQRGSQEPNDQVELVDRHTIRFRLALDEAEPGRGIDEFRVLTTPQP